jgi:hypothetical protein
MGLPTAMVVFKPLAWEEKVRLVESYGGRFRKGVARAQVDLVAITLFEGPRRWCVEVIETRRKRCGLEGTQ